MARYLESHLNFCFQYTKYNVHAPCMYSRRSYVHFKKFLNLTRLIVQNIIHFVNHWTAIFSLLLKVAVSRDF